MSRIVMLIHESSLRAGHGWRESLCRNRGCFKLLDARRLGRQAAGHPQSAFGVVKSSRNDCPTASVLLEAKAAALHPERSQSSLSKLSPKRGKGVAGKSSAGHRIGCQVIDRLKTDRSVERRPMSADIQADHAAS
jgi:hypothetical protein